MTTSTPSQGQRHERSLNTQVPVIEIPFRYPYPYPLQHSMKSAYHNSFGTIGRDRTVRCDLAKAGVAPNATDNASTTGKTAARDVRLRSQF